MGYSEKDGDDTPVTTSCVTKELGAKTTLTVTDEANKIKGLSAGIEMDAGQVFTEEEQKEFEDLMKEDYNEYKGLGINSAFEYIVWFTYF